ncbi:ATP-dependent DNA ligase [Streptomyces sp. HMX87]|uniref:ATP-dependent DNA ligase n=1 Tax=Streptomyces sp. HMX87 TaxID=3390849 RepID=UPI003A87D29A
MDLPVMPPVKPMLAKSVAKIPPGMQYEAKWDGFRAIVFRDGAEVEFGSRTGKPLTRYFPELADAVRERLPERCVVDGEIVIAREGRLDFDALTERIHPADSRVRMLAERTPASLVAFDLLALDGESLLDVGLSDRRALLVRALEGVTPPVHVAPATTDVAVARKWFEQYEGAGLDGVVAKPLDLRYRQDERAMYKVKHERTADVVVAGYRFHKSGPVVGSLLLGLYDDRGALQHVGVSAAFSMKRRQELVAELEPLRMDDVTGHPWGAWADEAAHETARLPGAPSRWSGKKDLSWVPLRPERVAEVAYDHMENGARFRHTARFRRWRPDRTPESCTYAQLEEPVRYDLAEILGGP